MRLLKVTRTEINEAGQLVVTAIASKATFTAEDCGPFGLDACPIPGVLALYNDTEKDGDEFFVGYLNIDRKAESGEVRFYAKDANGNVVFNIWLRADGTVLIGDADDPTAYTNFATKYNELKTGFDQLKADFNALVSIFNSHVHGGVTTGAGASAVSPTPGTASTASIASAKNDKVKFNS